MTDKLYQERKGGSYLVDAKTGRAQRVEATAEQSGETHRLEKPPAPPAADAPAAPPAATKKSEGKGD